MRAGPPGVPDPSQAAEEGGCLSIQNLLQRPGSQVLGAKKEGGCVHGALGGGGVCTPSVSP